MKHIPMEHQPYRQKRDHIRQHKCLLAQINCSGRKPVSLRILINVPSNFSKCVCKQFLLCNILPGLICICNDMYEICAKTFLEGTFMCAPSFLLCAGLMACLCRISWW